MASLFKALVQVASTSPAQSQLDDFLYALERGVSAFNADLAESGSSPHRESAPGENIDGARRKEGIGNLFTAVNLDIRASHKTDGLLDHFGVAYNDGRQRS